jgi:uncharacterized protein YndB with AHSA1/START domain
MSEKTSIIVEPGKPTIVITRVFDAPRRLVFEAWTKPEHLMRWWGPRDLTLSLCEVDLRPGGAWRFVLRAPDGNDYGFGASIARSFRPSGSCTRFVSTGRRARRRSRR